MPGAPQLARLWWLRLALTPALESAAASDLTCRQSSVCDAATSPAGPSDLYRYVWPVQGANAQEVAKQPPVDPMTMTNNASIATTEVLVSPKGEMIAVAPLTNEKGSLLSACATPCDSNPLPGRRVSTWTSRLPPDVS